jgi:hypothetical protein
MIVIDLENSELGALMLSINYTESPSILVAIIGYPYHLLPTYIYLVNLTVNHVIRK